MLNYFFTIISHIIDLFMVGRVMQYRFEIDVVTLLVVAAWWLWFESGGGCGVGVGGGGSGGRLVRVVQA